MPNKALNFFNWIRDRDARKIGELVAASNAASRSSGVFSDEWSDQTKKLVRFVKQLELDENFYWEG